MKRPALREIPPPNSTWWTDQYRESLLSMTQIDYERPAKKRRFFVEDPADAPPPKIEEPPTVTEVEKSTDHGSSGTQFDSQTLQAFVGEELEESVIGKLRSMSEGNIEQAINIYFDGSWKETPKDPPASIDSYAQSNGAAKKVDSFTEPNAQPRTGDIASRPRRKSMPKRRYIGAFGVVCWATRSGTGLVQSGEKVKIERTKTESFKKTGVTKKAKGPNLIGRQDSIVRFKNQRGEEVGRLETDSASWVSALIDQRICELDGHVVFAPDRVRSNDTIYLQLRAYLLSSIFVNKDLVKPLDDNRTTSFFEAKETQSERDLRWRQLALVKLFNEINLTPSKSNAATEKHKREELLKAAEQDEQKEQNAPNANSTQAESGGSSPPSEEAEEGEELQQDQLDSLYKKAQTFDFNTPEREPLDTFAMTLRKYQKQALHWMFGKETDTKDPEREQSMHPLWEEYVWPTKDVDDQPIEEVENVSSFYVNPYSGEMSLDFPVQEQNCLGGILADEMGLGKTIEMLSLIHSQRSEVDLAASKQDSSGVTKLPRLGRSSSGIEPAPCTTLVVAPMSLLAQWESEAEKASKKGSLKVLMYYGSDRGMSLKNLCCEANAASAPNVIITSYGTVLSEYSQIASAGGGSRSMHGGIFSIEYHRVILDEAHHIKNRQSKTAKACYDLAAKHRWVLTGTPIVNRLEDLFSLVHFLRVEPWSNFSFWKTFITTPFDSGDYIRALDVVQTVLEPLVLRRTKDMKTPDGEALVPLSPRTINVEHVELSQDERDVYDLIYNRAKRTFSHNVEAGTLMKSYTTIFAQILRLRQSCCHPVLTRNKSIVADEEDAANAADEANGLADDMDLQSLIERFTADAAEGTQDANRFGAHALKSIQDEAENECPLCFNEPMENQSVTGCWHSACKQCLVDYINHQKDKGELPRCFNCREAVNIRDVFEVVKNDDETPPPTTDLESSTQSPRISLRRVGTHATSAKVAALLTHLMRISKESPQTKSVIFSQFTSFLDLLEPELNRARIPFLRFDGTMAQKQRAAVLQSFSDSTSSRNNPAMRNKRGSPVLLLSLRAGGVGLNLTAANRVFMMDPWWSWAVEAQAIDRVHRMGQEFAVEVVRFVVGGSIEEKMLRIQERKKFLASSLGMMTEEERKTQRIEDIRELLS
ncbi:MAG: hypothetical protein Q9159_001108 [Coniocarpon cinnabarinum]